MAHPEPDSPLNCDSGKGHSIMLFVYYLFFKVNIKEPDNPLNDWESVISATPVLLWGLVNGLFTCYNGCAEKGV